MWVKNTDLALSYYSYIIYKEMDNHDCPYTNLPSRLQMWCKVIRCGVKLLDLDV